MNEDDVAAAKEVTRGRCSICLRPRGEGPIPAETDHARATQCWLRIDDSVEIAEAARCFDRQFHRLQADHTHFVEKAYAQLGEAHRALVATNDEILKQRRIDRRIVIAELAFLAGCAVAGLVLLLW